MRPKWRVPFGQALPLCIGLLAFQTTEAQVFSFADNDLILSFRKNTPYTESYEVVVNIGQASNYIRQAVDTTVQVPGFSPAQLSPGSFASPNNLSWSVFGAYSGKGYSGYTNDNTLWVTVPRVDDAVRSTPPTRLVSPTLQGSAAGKMTSIWGIGGASYISQYIGASNQFNTATFVREPISSYSQHILSVWMGGIVDSTLGTLNDTWPPDEPNSGNLENTTPDSFSGSMRSDLYEVRPMTFHGTPNIDPHTGTSSSAWYIGYFELNSDGTMTFTRQNADTTHPPPPPPVLSITRNAGTSTISFVSSNTAIYKLFFTNSAGLTTPVTNWPSALGSITGDGTTKSFQDNTTDPDRFYQVQGQ